MPQDYKSCRTEYLLQKKAALQMPLNVGLQILPDGEFYSSSDIKK
jgi:hypothetical protein